MGAPNVSPLSKSLSFFVTIATPNGNTTKKIDGDLLTVGRAEDCHLSIQHETLSRRHMSVRLHNGVCFVEDHGSSNGTFVNGKRLKPHTPTPVAPEDSIQLGQSGVKLSVAPEEKVTVPTAETIRTSTITERREFREAIANEPRTESRPPEVLVQEAHQKVATLIQEAEIDAERRVEDIYRRAHATQAKMDLAYQKKLNEAYRSAEVVYQKAQTESESILDQARAKSAEIRAQAEGFVMDLRRRTEEDCERILEEAQATARELKEQRLAEADDLLRKKEDELVRNTNEAMSTRIARFDEEMRLEAARQRENLDAELNELKAEVSRLAVDRDHARKIKDEVSENEKRHAELGPEVARLTKLRDESRAGLDKIKISGEEVDRQLSDIRAKFEDAKADLQRQEQKHLEEMKLETTRKVAALEQQMVDELLTKKEGLSREIGLMLETIIKEYPEMNAKAVRQFNERLAFLMDAQVAALSKSPAAAEKQKSLIQLKSREKRRATWLGFAIGAAVVFGGQNLYQELKGEFSPMQRRVNAIQDERKADLEKRKFNPAQNRVPRETYADSVVHTENFTKIYRDEEFQKKLLAEAAPFMLKTWRLDEEKTIQLLAATNALVKILQERRDAIHPDYVPQGLDKMREAEAEATARIRQLLGSQVRFESFRKFERKFFEENAKF